MNLTQSELKHWLHYNPDTGLFFRRTVRRGSKEVGSLVGTKGARGYLSICINNRLFYAHRLAFLWMTGEFPAHQVDHINGDRTDNRWCNLRTATVKENAHNHGALPAHNTSGFIGATWNKRDRVWRAQIQVDGRVRYIGAFPTPELAHAAYLKAKDELHPTHQRLRKQGA